MKLRFILLLLAALLLAGCSARKPLLYGAAVTPAEISPNADGVADVARLTYEVSRPATVSIYLVDEAGVRHVFRQAASRPRGSYEALFSGVIEDRLLPDGCYACVFEAQAADGESARAEIPLILAGGAADYIEIRNLNIYPALFTPNRDGITDRVTIAYYLTKEAAKVQAYLLSATGEKYPLPEDKIRPVGQVGNHEHDYEGGVDLGATPPPNGTYTVVVEAEDAVGNRDVARGSLTIADGGVPQVQIVNRAAEWSATTVPLGGTLTFTCTVRNTGKVGVRTKGPASGTLYTTSENFNSKAMYEEPGVFRIGLDFEGNSSGRSYPFRWQLGLDADLAIVDGQAYLMPGQTALVVGHLEIVDPPAKVAPTYWIGLLHEQVQIVEDRVEPLVVTIGF